MALPRRAIASAAERLDERGFDAMRFRGPGTDCASACCRRRAGRRRVRHGRRHRAHANLPTEEVFTAPDPQRVDGEVRATKPLVLGGTTIEGLRVRFEGGRAVGVDADTGGEALRGDARRDEGAARLGELALVDREGRIGPMDTVFYDTLLDENAASHIALGAAYEFTVRDEADVDAHQPQRHPHRLHDRLAGDRRSTGIDGRRQSGPGARDGVWQI